MSLRARGAHPLIVSFGGVMSRTEDRPGDGGVDLYRAMFERSPLPMWLLDRETWRFVAVNDAVVQHYGYSRQELAVMTLADLRPIEEVAALHRDAGSAAGLVAPRQWRHRKKDGTVITVEVTTSDFVLDGRQVRLVVIADVTERARARRDLQQLDDRLRHAQKMEAVGRLAGGVAHDFNNTLTVIQSYASMLEEALEPSDQRHEDAAPDPAGRGAGDDDHAAAPGGRPAQRRRAALARSRRGDRRDRADAAPDARRTDLDLARSGARRRLSSSPISASSNRS